MSMAMFSKSEEAEEDTWSTVIPDKRSQYGWRSRCPVWWIRAAAVCLGLLLLVVIFCLVVHNAGALGQQDSLLGRLVERERLICNLTTDNEALRGELNRVKVNSSRLADQIEELQRRFSSVAASRDNLLQEYRTLNSSTASAHASAISQRDGLQDRLTRCEKTIRNLTTDNKALGDELSHMKINSSRLKEELQRLNNTAAQTLSRFNEWSNNSTACRVCEPGWMNFNNKCYFASTRGKNKNWEDSKNDCLQKGAKLVMPKTRQEVTIVAKLNDRTWIGLSDKKQEGKWVWVDGTELQTGFWQTGEPNNERNEDCAEISRPTGEWNDVLCGTRLPWICEM